MTTSIQAMSSVTRVAEFMVGVLIIVFVLFVLMIFMYLYAKRYPGAVPVFGRGAARYIFPSTEPESSVDAAVPACGLDPKAIKALPFIVFKPEEFEQKGMDCAVCLSEVSTGEKVRVLPKCNHGFHLDCIDMWLFSHCTCPLCRCPVADDLVPAPVHYAGMVTGIGTGTGTDTAAAESVPNFPTNVLFWGSQDEISSGVAALETPRPPAENPSPPPPAAAVDDAKSASSTRIRSLSKMLVRGSRGIIIGNSCNPRNGGGGGGDDIELGLRNIPAMAESSNHPIAATSS